MLFHLHLPKTHQEVSHHTFISPLTDSLHYSIGMTDCSLLQGILQERENTELLLT